MESSRANAPFASSGRATQAALYSPTLSLHRDGLREIGLRMSEELATAEFRCPGVSYSISRAVHLSRLADYYPACRECPRRTDVARPFHAASAPARRGLFATARAAGSKAEGCGGVAINDIKGPSSRRGGRSGAASSRAEVRRLSCQKTASQPIVVFASDGRLATAMIVAAIVEGIRWTGCETIDLGPASARPCISHGNGKPFSRWRDLSRQSGRRVPHTLVHEILDARRAAIGRRTVGIARRVDQDAFR